MTAGASGVSVVGSHQVLYRGGTNGYGCFRIPVLSRTTSGTLLAFAEARKSPTCADRGDIDLVVRRSTNDGRTWGPIRVVAQGNATDQFAPFTRGNPVPVVDRTTGKILLITTSNEATPTGRRLPWIQQSADDGLTWTAPKPLGASMDGTNNGWFATGPAHGIQLEHGAHAGRLIVGAHQKPGSEVVLAGVLYSDDHGETWQASRTENSYVKDVLSPGEIVVTELPDGSLYAGARNEVDDSDHRARAVSTDGGTTMPKFSLVPSLVTPNVQGSVLALKNTYRTTPGDVLIFSSPGDPQDRKQMRIRYSTDRGTTWASASNGLVTNDRSGYSDVAELTGGEIGLLYEGGTSFSADEIRFTRFTPAQLGLPGTTHGTPSSQPAQAAGLTTPDSTVEANDAYLKGNATVNDGLLLDGTGDYADVPYSRTIDPGSGDFTLSLRFRYQATDTTRNQVLFWGYGTGASVPQIWIRLQPDDDQVTAWVEGASGGANVSVKDGSAAVAFGDDTWHQLTVVRTGGQMRLTVGTASVTADGIAGPVSAGVTGIRLGGKQDAGVSDALAGRIKDVELTRGGKRVLHLAMTKIDRAAVPGRTATPITEDVSGHCATATVLGGIQTDVGRPNSRALKVDSSHPGVETPFSSTLDLGAGDFTMAAWFKYSATVRPSNQALVWAYGTTSGKRALWVRAQPSQDRLYAWVETGTDAVGVELLDTTSRTAFGDNAWHLLALTRTGGQVQLSVDGGNPATATGLTGSVSADQSDDIKGLRLGSKMDGTDVMQGMLDDFRLYHRALTAAELDTAATGRFPGDMPALWWTFENQNTQAHDIADPVTGPQTPDSSVHCVNAKVLGAPAVVAGRYGTALQFDGTDDEAYMPYRPSIALADSDFTVSTWVKYSATDTTADQVILWAYGTGATERSMWLRAQPGKDRIYGYLQTDTGAYEMAVADLSAAIGFGDNTWHLVTIRRSGNTLELLVDDNRSTGQVAGSLTYGDAFAVDGIRLGVKPDGTNRFKGSLDEFRIHRRALTDAELAGNVDLGPVTAVHLPFTNAS
ncbi:sialidase-1 [Kibdelosporangium banguiense]|uniref:exo-alpha-sialidase n=1 Tax=Kibdelosporangium banguiense TaxID=1365924 RepID=A0ABS4U0L7_9PSEU|nr:LamG-like jellyroll fold domain-containing protein [Kibdelosporangium banguiense]MBP2329711.1 sialidase-1 [Kibdelosporangium banguiense]